MQPHRKSCVHKDYFCCHDFHIVIVIEMAGIMLYYGIVSPINRIHLFMLCLSARLPPALLYVIWWCQQRVNVASNSDNTWRYANATAIMSRVRGGTAVAIGNHLFIIISFCAYENCHIVTESMLRAAVENVLHIIIIWMDWYLYDIFWEHSITEIMLHNSIEYVE